MLIAESITLVILVAVLYIFFGNPNAYFRSSDSNWADGESLYKGRDFARVLAFYETYKLDCDVPDVTLVRTTPVHWYNVFGWPSYLLDVKWKIPYGNANPKIGEYYEPPCMDGGSTGVGELKAMEYLRQLSAGRGA